MSRFSKLLLRSYSDFTVNAPQLEVIGFNVWSYELLKLNNMIIICILSSLIVSVIRNMSIADRLWTRMELNKCALLPNAFGYVN